ncbi:hypothetical protein Tco_0771525 [Tanacetum coccineum]|uniref:Reverse transcriptase domain-containing protein n=1 Tax=Tanacetum coccineum TaxID=301880 RepID=A0ABQ4ZFB1_9ASTR
MVYVVNGVLASGVDMLLTKDFVCFALQVMKIHPLMLLILSMILQIFLTTLHNHSTNQTRTSYVEMILTMVMIVHHGDEHLSTILEKELDEFIKSSIEDLVPIPSESKDLTDYKSEYDMPVCDDSSSKNEGLDDIVSIPLGKEINHLDVIPDLVQSLLNHANSIIFLIKEFAGKLAPVDPIPSRIVFDPEEDIRLIEKLLNDDSSPLEELNSKIPDVIIESFSPSHNPVEDSDSLMEEIDIFLAPDDSIPPGIESDDYDLEGNFFFFKNSLNDDSLSLPEYDHFTELYVHVPNVLPTLPTLYPEFDTLLPFSSKNEDKVFNPGILISKKEKSPHLLSHQGFKVFQLINDSESPIMIYGGDIPILDVPYFHFYPP